MQLPIIDKSWTLFLDRDGVINHDTPNSYVFNADGFKFFDNVPEAIKIFSELFSIIVVVTNQKGVGRGLMTLDDLNGIHTKMLKGIGEGNGRIDKIYFCTDLEDSSPNRKPNPGMAFQAKSDFPAIDFSKSIMVGNKLSDMQFAKSAGISTTVFLPTTNPETAFPHPLIDLRFNNLMELAEALTKS